ncbi:MAG: hydroxymethylbilane synthase [Thermodesulfobacteriota bacterium]
MMKKCIKIGTRGSMLALWQSNWVKGMIEGRYPGVTVELVRIVTKGDKILDVPLAMVGGKGLFVKEIEDALLREEVDIAVHSMKDVPTVLPDELHIGIITKREDPRDAFLSVKYGSVAELPAGARVGTSSLRRKSQLAAMRSDLVIEDLRGNLDTRVRKLDEGVYDAVILATAGLNRLNMAHRITAHFSPEQMLPAIAQGAVGIELRKKDSELLDGLRFMDDRDTAVAVSAERAFLARLEGGCQVPIGGHGRLEGGRLIFTGLIASVDGKQIFKESVSGDPADAAAIGHDLAERMLRQGAGKILAEVYNTEIS